MEFICGGKKTLFIDVYPACKFLCVCIKYDNLLYGNTCDWYPSTRRPTCNASADSDVIYLLRGSNNGTYKRNNFITRI